MPASPKIRIGTRGSALARWQADWVAMLLQSRGVEVELVPIVTQGDRHQSGPIGAIGTQGVFTKELQRALLSGEVDVSVHSLKDLPTEQPGGLCLAAVPPRESPGDVLISRDAARFAELPEGAVLGTGSVRRQSQLLHARADLRVEDIRGNVDTRLRKLRDGQFAAIVLAEAGLKRLGLADQITEVLPKTLILPAVGQGALGLEARTDDAKTRELLSPLDDEPTHQAVLAERALLARLRGGCLAPVGAWARIESDDLLHLDAVVLSRDGARRIDAKSSGLMADAIDLGRKVADELIGGGALELIQAARE